MAKCAKFKLEQVVHDLEKSCCNDLVTITSKELYDGKWHYIVDYVHAGLLPENRFRPLTKRERGES